MTVIYLNSKPIKKLQFPNRESLIRDTIPYPENNIVELKFRGNQDLVHLLFVKKQLDELGVPASLFVWYMPYSRMDRKIDGDMFTLKYICEFVADLNFVRIVVVEPHSSVTVQLLENFGQNVSCVYPTLEWLPTVMAKMSFNPDYDTVVLPDKNAADRYQNLDCKTVILAKIRNPKTGRILDMKLVDGQVNFGSKCLILDDICSKGGTFLRAGQILRDAGAASVALLVTHLEAAVFRGKLLNEISPIDKIFASQSLTNRKHLKIDYLKLEVNRYV
ncbi:MAG: ribose-phosphate pyrophosphokinase [Candidatus Nomurabacteria bacterium]|jgi:ribose-phosphate pyrophosphokinase|nr:ribose-phosphate pyrophosphokinase [Candidatus Nomurabacteria bacterium]